MRGDGLLFLKPNHIQVCSYQLIEISNIRYKEDIKDNPIERRLNDKFLHELQKILGNRYFQKLNNNNILRIF